MLTRTIEFKIKPSDPDPSLIVEVSYAGDIVSASGYCPIIDDWLDCTAFIKNDKHWNKSIDERFGEIDWTDHGDEKYDEFKDGVTLLKDALRPA